MADHSEILYDSAHLSDIFVLSLNPTSSERNLEDAMVLSDVFERAEFKEMHNPDTLENSITLSDVFSLRSKHRYERNLKDGVGLVDRFHLTRTARLSRYLEDGTVLGDAFGLRNTRRTNLSFEDGTVLGDRFVLAKNLALGDGVSLYDGFGLVHNADPLQSFGDAIRVTDAFTLKFALFVIGGTGDGSYEHGTNVPINAVLGRDEKFLVWAGETQFVDDAYAASTFVRMPNETVRIEAIKGKVSFEDIQMLEGRVSAGKLDIIIEQGSSFERNVYYRDPDGNPVNMTGYTAAMHVRKYKGATEALLTLTSSAGYITVGETGHLEIHIPANETDDLNFVWGYYDLELYPEGDATQAFRLLEGRIKLTKEVTR